MTREFYKNSWNILKSELIEVFEFFKNEIINKRCDETYICLIPTKKKPTWVSEFGPISLVTSLFKIISEVLIKSLKNVIPSIIHDTQMSFGKGG